MEEGLRFSAIDIGSNAMRLLFTRVIINGGDPSFIKESLIRMPLRLGHDAFVSGSISSDVAEKFIQTMHGFMHMINAYEPLSFRACATSAMRTADNGLKLVQRVKQETGLEIEIINGKDEAALILANHIERTLKPKRHYIYIDVGGGSTELTLIFDKQVLASRSFPIGSVRLLEEKVTEKNWQDMEAWVKENTAECRPIKAIGSGGNINKIAALLGKKKGDSLNQKDIKDTLAEIKPFDYHDRIVKLGMRPDRADVISHAGSIYLNCLKWSGAKKMVVPQVGLPDGIITQLYKEYKTQQG